MRPFILAILLAAPLQAQGLDIAVVGATDAASLADVAATLADLENSGVRRIVVVRLFVSGESFLRETEYLLGLDDTVPAVLFDSSRVGGMRPVPDPHAVPPIAHESEIAISMTGLVDEALAGRILAERALAIRGGSFDLAINGRDFGSGVTDQQVTVPAYSDAQVTVRMVSTVFGMLRLFQGLQEEGRDRLDYEISGHFSLVDAFGGVSFHESGEIALPRGTAEGV